MINHFTRKVTARFMSEKELNDFETRYKAHKYHNSGRESVNNSEIKAYLNSIKNKTGIEGYMKELKISKRVNAVYQFGRVANYVAINGVV